MITTAAEGIWEQQYQRVRVSLTKIPGPSVPGMLAEDVALRIRSVYQMLFRSVGIHSLSRGSALQELLREVEQVVALPRCSAWW